MWFRKEQKKPSRKGFLAWLKETKRLSIIEQFSIRNVINTLCYYSVMKKVTKIRLVEIDDPIEAKRAVDELYLLPDFDSWDEKNSGKFRHILSLYSEYLKTFGGSEAEESTLTSLENNPTSEDMSLEPDVTTVHEDHTTELINKEAEYNSGENVILDSQVETCTKSIEEHTIENLNEELSDEISRTESYCCTQIAMDDSSPNNRSIDSIPSDEENESDRASSEESDTIDEIMQINTAETTSADSDPSEKACIEETPISESFDGIDYRNTESHNDSENMNEFEAKTSEDVCVSTCVNDSNTQSIASCSLSKETELETLLNMESSHKILHSMGFSSMIEKSLAENTITNDHDANIPEIKITSQTIMNVEISSEHTVEEEIFDPLKDTVTDSNSEESIDHSESGTYVAAQIDECSIEEPELADISDESNQKPTTASASQCFINETLVNNLAYASQALGMTLGDVLNSSERFTMGDFCGMNPKDYLDVLIDDLDISDQAYRKIQRVCFYIDDLLRIPIKSIFELRSVDLKILIEVLSSLSDYSKKDISMMDQAADEETSNSHAATQTMQSNASSDISGEKAFEEFLKMSNSPVGDASTAKCNVQNHSESEDSILESETDNSEVTEHAHPAEYAREATNDENESGDTNVDSEVLPVISKDCVLAATQNDRKSEDEQLCSDIGNKPHQNSTNAVDDHKAIDHLECNSDISKMPLDKVLTSENDFTLGEFCGLDPELYQGIPITELNLSTRAHRIMRGVGLHIGDILKASVKYIHKLSGMGRKSLTEVVDALLTYSQTATLDPSRPIQAASADENDSLSLTPGLIQYQEALLNGEWDAIDESSLSAADQKLLRAYQEAHEILGTEMVQYAANNKSAIRVFSEGVDDFSKLVEWQAEVRQQIAKLPAERRTLKARGFIATYFSESPETKWNAYEALFGGFDGTLEDFQDVDEMPSEARRHDLSLFLNWCNFDLADDISEINQSIRAQKRAETVIKARAQDKTLQEISEMLDITRERVRQIEASVIRRLSNLIIRQKLLLKISALRNADTVLTVEELQEYFGDDSEWLIYLLSNVQDSSYSYGKMSRIFTIGSETMIKRARQYVESLPDIINKANLGSILEAAEQEEGLPGELIERQIISSYKQTSVVYYRNSLTLSYMCAQILQKYYPAGIYIYDMEAVNRFNQHMMEDFGKCADTSESIRSLGARIADMGILCDKGTYKAKQDHYISPEMIEKIVQYIEEYPYPVLLIKSLYEAFEDDLMQEGINNRYYLHGVMKEVFGDKYTYRREYLCKDANMTSLYETIVEYVKSLDYPIGKQQLIDAFPHIPDYSVGFAVMDERLLNFFSEYLHVEKIRITKVEKQEIKGLIDELLSDEQTHNMRELYALISSTMSNTLSRNYVRNDFALFSLLEWMFKDVYQFKRPYIARNGAELVKANGMLLEYVRRSKVTQVKDLIEYAHERQIRIFDQTITINSLNDEFMLFKHMELMSIEDLGVNEEIASMIEEQILEEIDGPVAIRSLLCMHSFPKISVEWSDWLVYSVLNRWSEQLEVDTSYHQMRFSIPMVAPRGLMNEEAKNAIGFVSTEDQTSAYHVTSSIEDLVAEFLMEEDGFDEFI